MRARTLALFTAPLFSLLSVPACSSSTPTATPSDDAGAGLDATAPVDGSAPGPDAGDAGPAAFGVDAAACAQKPTTGDFPLDVAAVLQAKCQTCHKSPPINHAPFPLLTYENTLATDPLAPYAGAPVWEAMSYVIQPGAVPHMPFGTAPQLTPAELQTLSSWLFSCAMPVAEGTGGDIGEDGGAAPANVLVSDQYNNRVIELTRAGTIVWSFGDGKSVPGPTSVVAPNDAERLPNGETLISGTGTGAGTEPACAADGGGCPDNRVLIVNDATKAIVWQYGADNGVSGSGPGQLSSPVAAAYLPTSLDGGADPSVLITDQGNARIIQVSRATKAITWQYPPTGADGGQLLNNPNSAERLANGNTLIADEGGNRVIEVKPDGTIFWQYPATIDTAKLSGPAFASRLPTGNTLITDSNNNRVVEIDSATPPTVVWTYSTATRNPALATPLPTRAVRLVNGDTLISDQFNDQVIEIDNTAAKAIVFTYGQLGVPGSAAGQLNGPYDAKVIGDFTGLTPPQ